MANADVLDDPVWQYVLNSKLSIYVPHARKFWENIEDIDLTGTGVYPITGDGVPPGFMYRVTNTPVRSPIKHVQVFPFVPVSYLQITNVAGGATRMVSRVCADGQFTMEEFTIVEKHNLPSTYHQGQFVAFVPTAVLNGAHSLGKWVYMTVPEMIAVARTPGIPKSVMAKIVKFI